MISVRLCARLIAVLVCLGAATRFASAGEPVRTTRAAPQRALLTRYLEALQHERYEVAFALLSPPERAYFGSAANLASAYRADRVRVVRFHIVKSTTLAEVGTVVTVRERVTFYDFAHQGAGGFTADVRYGVVPTTKGLAIKDPYHPWYAFDPVDVSVEKNGVRATVRKVSFFTGRVELLVTFANVGRESVTLLPYGRTVLRDAAGVAHVPLATKLAGLTDKTLFEGLVLAPSAEYTGALDFATVDRYLPKTLALTISPALADGGDAPFDFPLPTFEIPQTR